MSGYVFNCTPCGKAHAGECPPRSAPVETPLTDGAVEEVMITVGSRWKQQTKLPGGAWTDNMMNTAGYEVISVVSNGTYKGSYVQVTSWKAPKGAPVYTLTLDWWEEEGMLRDPDGTRGRMIAWT